jgi:hypothetical protein
LKLDNNSFSGSLPSQWQLDRPSVFALNLDISNNELTGTLPSEWSFNISGFRASNNFLSGTLPASWGARGKLEAFNVSNNMITGTLPPTWINFDSGLEFDASHNLLTGGLPEEWGPLFSGYAGLNLNHNRLGGPLPKWLPVMQMNYLWLRNNSFNGTLPDNRLSARYKYRSRGKRAQDAGNGPEKLFLEKSNTDNPDKDPLSPHASGREPKNLL